MYGTLRRHKLINSVILIVLLVVGFGVDSYYRGYTDNVFFFSGMRTSDSAKAKIIDQYGENLNRYKVYFVTDGNEVFNNWYFYGNVFFQLYSKNSSLKVIYVSNIESIPYEKENLDNLLVFGTRQADVVDLSAKVKNRMSKRPEFPTISSFDFVKLFPQGKINSTNQVQTPTGRGVFEINWPNELGSTKTITILTGFDYSYENIVMPPDGYLRFNAALPYNRKVTDGAQAYIEVTGENGTRRRIFAADLLPAKDDGTLQWGDYLLPVQDYTGQKVMVTFGVTSPSGNGNGDWIAFSEVQLVSQKSS